MEKVYFSANAPKILKTCILVYFDLKMTNPKSERGGRTPFPRYPPFTAPCKSTGNPGVANTRGLIDVVKYRYRALFHI